MSTTLPPVAASDPCRRAVRRATRRLMPLFCLMYLIAYIDRQNVSYAKLEMVGALGLSEAAYGLGASLFFLGYFFFEAPANLILAKVGARAWFARIMLTWGAVTVALGFTQNAAMFYVLRFLLGAAEAGFFPGVLYVLTLWYPQSDRARMVGLFMVASAVANAVGAVIGGALLDLDQTFGLAGWQWVFVATGLPAVLLAPFVLLWLPSHPGQARWLPQDEREALLERLRLDTGEIPAHDGAAWRTIFDLRVLRLAGLYIGLPLGAYGLSYWLPTIVRGFGVSHTVNGLINIAPWALVALALWLYPRTRAGHEARAIGVAGPLFVAAAALVLSVMAPWPWLQFALICIAAPAIFIGQPLFWSWPPRFLLGAHAAAGIAAINSIGNLGGFAAQNLVPVVRDVSGSDLAPMLALATALGLAGALIMLDRRRLEAPLGG
ncbi:MFS transporter [Phenylobacterium sp.]|uniref:MFS transporter n=1 Tax=Phenylobacterium sp. TaxID=1871053 RepID=UPI0035B405D2